MKAITTDGRKVEVFEINWTVAYTTDGGRYHVTKLRHVNGEAIAPQYYTEPNRWGK